MLSVTDFITENLEGKSGKISCDTTPCDVTFKDKNTIERLSFGLMSAPEPSNQEDGRRQLATQEDTQGYQCHHGGTEILPAYPSKFSPETKSGTECLGTRLHHQVPSKRAGQGTHPHLSHICQGNRTHPHLSGDITTFIRGHPHTIIIGTYPRLSAREQSHIYPVLPVQCIWYCIVSYIEL